MVLHAAGRHRRARRRLVGDPELERVNGRCFDGHQEALAAAEAYDVEYRRRLAAITDPLR